MPTNDDLVHGWVSTDCGRGTSDILWSCLATTFICVWTTIHLPVPLFLGQRPLSLRQKLIRSGIGTALISFIAPEFLAITAVSAFLISRKGREKMKRFTQTDWSLTHQYFLEMGGICLRSPNGMHFQIVGEEAIQVMEGSRNPGKENSDTSHWIRELEKLTEDQMHSYAKSDTLSKLITCGQALWLVTQIISRLSRHQAVTLLEVSTCAYVSCALLSYAAWWKKPQGCSVPIVIDCSDDAMSEAVRCRSFEAYYETETWAEFVWAGRHWLGGSPISPYEVHYDLDFDSFVMLLVLCLASFGIIHVASWNTRLPSNVEQWMWRLSSVYCLFGGLFIVILIQRLIEISSWVPGIVHMSCASFLIIVYIIVRMYMIVEVFLSLRALPRSAFESVQWSSFVPHL